MQLELKYVHNIYDNIAKDFSKTRYKIWPCVKQFIESIPQNQNIIELGCGNGKNLIQSNIDGLDYCQAFVDICITKGLNVRQGDILSLPFIDNSYDHSMSIAVIHHLSTRVRRLKAISEMIRVTKPGGLIFILVWIDIPIKPDTEFVDDGILLPFTGQYRYYHIFRDNELLDLISTFDVEIIKTFIDGAPSKSAPSINNNYGIIFRKRHTIL